MIKVKTEVNPSWVSAPKEITHQYWITTEAGTQIQFQFHLKGENYEDFDRVEKELANLIKQIK